MKIPLIYFAIKVQDILARFREHCKRLIDDDAIIWRDEHFNGMTIREIAKRDKRSDAFVGGMIRKTFEIA